MDAISFVLGIKSSHLRSSHLRELVYRGRVMKTSKIQDDGTAVPATNGQVNGHEDGDDEDSSQRASRNDPKTAWVMAVYEDDAGEEQRWKRTITSSGASEYRINDRVVTAQQYNEALEEENILIKARNFLVFQGDVEAIASQSPQDLTRLIEQISGSLEYKDEYERLQAEVEQAAENQNFQLHRRRGINSEIKQYQEQKREAENFQKKTQERDEAVITHILWKLYHFQRVMDESSAQIQEHHENLKEFRRNVETFEKRLEAARKEQATVGREVSHIEKSIKSKEKSIENRDNSLVPIDEKITQSSQDMAILRKRISDVKKDRDDKATNIQKLKKDLATIEKAQQQFEKQWSETLKKQGKELSDADRKEYTSLQAEAMRKTSDNRAKLANLERQLKGDEVTVNSLKGRIDNFEAAIEKLQSEAQVIKDRRDAIQDSVGQTARDIDAKKKEFNSVQSERIRINNTHTELEEKLRDVLRKLDDADMGRRQNEKETKMRSMISDLKRIYPGVRGRVGELCKPKQKKYDEAVITALGREFDAVVVDTEKTGVDCVQYLKDQRFPPVTFIPLDNIKVNTSNSAVKGISGARLTIDTIDFDPSLERAIAYACGGSVVCDSLEIAKDIVYNRKIQVKAVTLQGYVIHKAGTMSGGRLPEEKGGKRRFEEHDVQNLERLAEKFRDEIAKLPRPGRRGVAEESLQNEIAALEQRLRLQESELAAFEKNLKSKEKELEHAKQQLREYQPKYAEKEGELQRTRATVEKFEKAISEVEDKIFANFCRRLGYENIRAYEAQQGSLEQEAAQKRQDFGLQKQRIQNNLTWETSQHDAANERVRAMETTLKRHQKDLEAYEREKRSIEEARAQDQDELAALQESLEEVRASYAEKSKKVADAKQDLQKKTREIESRLKEISNLEGTVQKNSTQKFALLRRCKLEQIQLPLRKGSLDNIPNEDVLLQRDQDAMDIDGEADEDEVLENAMDDYGIEIDFDGLDEDLKKPDDDIEDRLQEKITSLTSELEKLNPNMRAMERLESVKSRLEATEKDFEDSRAALRAAREAFAKVKEKRFELFNRAFTHIQEQITHVYKDLTRSDAYPLGGQAYLDIEEDTDTPYLSGIKYHAMPPLKRFRDMEHLSGGEKTMAALALLFAIHSYHPSPFFVLDEVDAALDNANVEKIKKYIREHAGPGMQFIVISLKPTLFQDSESLVGVYRDQEANTSRTLTLDLRKYV
ncbi:SMC1-like protein [Thermothelomyces thermophilus ATCC 42464]|uniref:Structural maintenance of chromosomes protein n=1 Tax=Thermothelomyces thermophilus (strain ATCC 42464 / BCRC 31852 / DSM 1799) TaxID=573729 RepID=G2Q854_THET4|nr:SMC1-like protein [Thermothelomyces thermophilus ATCC 42464]AEO56157.1 SMC1-like protein [Thermothelomyces thermophilus ATCC 42464]